jgi:glutamine---fructose-6-phosphate transaminase (isomerizing)
MTQLPSSKNQPVAGEHTRIEIYSQAESWQGAIDAVIAQQADISRFFAQHANRPVVFVGCGSPYYLNLTAASVYRELTGKLAMAVPASELLLNLDNAFPGGSASLVVAVSRSGETTELVAACKMLKEQHGSPLVLITVSNNTSLQKLADLSVVIANASEQSVAQTRSFSAMLLATLATIAIVAKNDQLLSEFRQLPALVLAYLDRIQQPIAELISRGFERIFFLGSGLRHGLAHEGSLKMKEMSLSNSEPFYFMEFRHGPQSMVDEHTLIVGLVSAKADATETQVLREMVQFGGSVAAISSTPGHLRSPHYVDIETVVGLSEIAQLILYMPALHLLAYNQAMRKGLDCDNPRNLHAWIKLPGFEA